MSDINDPDRWKDLLVEVLEATQDDPDVVAGVNRLVGELAEAQAKLEGYRSDNAELLSQADANALMMVQVGRERDAAKLAAESAARRLLREALTELGEEPEKESKP